ncbi:MAG: hypothetical protein SO188_14445 [Prevotella sp.]|nr:hypothetical protein [Prevotella sp.]
MKKYLIICENQESADKVNDFIAVNSLFTEGETITDPVARWGKSYTDDERVFNAIRAYIQEGGEGVKVYNLCEFEFIKDNIELRKDDEGRTQVHRLAPTVYHINIDEDHITVNGYQMKVKYKYGYTYQLLKTYIGTSSHEELAHFIQDESWKHSACPKTICEHVIAHGKKCA